MYDVTPDDENSPFSCWRLLSGCTCRPRHVWQADCVGLLWRYDGLPESHSAQT